MSRRKKYKVGDRIFFDKYDGTIGSDIVLDIIPKSYIDDNGEEVKFNQLVTYKSEHITCICEDYNTLPYSDPRVKALMKEFKKQDRFANLLRDFVLIHLSTNDTKTIAAALMQVAKEMGGEDE